MNELPLRLLIRGSKVQVFQGALLKALNGKELKKKPRAPCLGASSIPPTNPPTNSLFWIGATQEWRLDRPSRFLRPSDQKHDASNRGESPSRRKS